MQQEKEQVALSSIAASAGLTIAKAGIGFATGSLAILSEAGHSLIDLGATVMTYLAVRVSGRPADEEHHYGHGKIESVSALAETALLFLLSGVVIWQALKRLLEHAPHMVNANIWAFGVIVISIAVDFVRSRSLSRAAQKTASHALAADALHFSSDLWSSLAVLVGLVGIRFGLAWADSAAALAVAVFVCIAGWRLGRRTIDILIDVAPAGAAERITAIADRVPGVVSVGRVRARAVGDKTFIDLNVAVSRALPLDRVSGIKDAVAAAIRGRMPEAEPLVNTTPVALDNETVLDRVMVIARNRGLAVHHVTVHELKDRLAVSLDLEVDGSLSLRAAHDLADELENAIALELGPDVDVESHIEPLQPQETPGRAASSERVLAVEAALAQLAKKDGTLDDVHDVRVLETGDGEIVNFHCTVDPGLSVQSVHERVDELERALRERLPAVRRVIGHAEPKRG
jgi:cation diffusion facilitator family transporter